MKPTIRFLTGNQHKLQEAQAIVGNQISIAAQQADLPEIQSTAVAEVVQAKLLEAQKQYDGALIVEDTGLCIAMMRGFPGALIKSYLAHLGNEGIAQYNGGSQAYAETIIGYTDGRGNSTFFQARVDGFIASAPQGEGFGWDPIFIPAIEGMCKTFAAMTLQEKNQYSMRSKAFRLLRKHLQSR